MHCFVRKRAIWDGDFCFSVAMLSVPDEWPPSVVLAVSAIIVQLGQP